VLFGCRAFYCRGRSVPPTRPWRPGYALGLPRRLRWVPGTAFGPAATARTPWIPRSPAGGALGGVSLLAHNNRGASRDLAECRTRGAPPAPPPPTATAAVPRGGGGSLTELRLAAAVAQAAANVSAVAAGVTWGRQRPRGARGWGHLSLAARRPCCLQRTFFGDVFGERAPATR
jgi:hypothetical protein